MEPDFDRITHRRGTGAIKWEYHEVGGELQPRPMGSDLLAPGELLCMGLADMDLPTAPAIIDALGARVAHGIFGYTYPPPAYFDAIVGWLHRRHTWRIDPSWIVTTPGVMQSVNFLVHALTEPGDPIIVQSPGFRPIADAVRNNERLLLDNALRLEDGRYQMDLVDLEEKAASTHARMLILCNPHNPVGRAWSRETLNRLGEICCRHDLMIVSDEIHADLTYSWARFTPMGAVDANLNDRLAVCYGPSKAFNLPGLRTSLAIIPDEEIRRRFLRILRNVNELFGVNLFGTVAMQAAFEQGDTWMNKLLAYLESNYLFLETYLKQHVPRLRPLKPDALYLVWIDCRGLGLPPATVADFFRQEARVQLESGVGFGAAGEGFVRMNIACPRIVLATALDRIRTAVDERRSE